MIVGPGGTPPWRVQGRALGTYLLNLSVAFGALFTVSRRGFCVGAARLIDASIAHWRAFLRQCAMPPNGF